LLAINAILEAAAVGLLAATAQAHRLPSFRLDHSLSRYILKIWRGATRTKSVLSSAAIRIAGNRCAGRPHLAEHLNECLSAPMMQVVDSAVVPDRKPGLPTSMIILGVSAFGALMAICWMVLHDIASGSQPDPG